MLIDSSADVGKSQAAVKKHNAIAIADFMMAFASEALMGLIDKAKMSDWPSGLVHLIVIRLKKKFQLMDTISHVES